MLLISQDIVSYSNKEATILSEDYHLLTPTQFSWNYYTIHKQSVDRPFLSVPSACILKVPSNGRLNCPLQSVDYLSQNKVPYVHAKNMMLIIQAEIVTVILIWWFGICIKIAKLTYAIIDPFILQAWISLHTVLKYANLKSCQQCLMANCQI